MGWRALTTAAPDRAELRRNQVAALAKAVSQNKEGMLPIIIAPLVTFVILPWAVALMPFLEELFGITPNDTQGLIN